jgi:phospholipase/carboxylesterase
VKLSLPLTMLTTDFVPAVRLGSPSLLIAFHGLGDSMEGYRWMPDELNLPWLNYLLVNAPDDYYGGFSWYDIYGKPEPGIARSRAMISELLDLQIARGFPAECITLFGFSQGCLMVLETALRYPSRLAGLIGVSGYVHDVQGLVNSLSAQAREQRVLMTHGTEDPLIPIAPVRQQVRILREAGIQIEWREFRKVHTIAGVEEIALIRDFIAAGQSPKQ